MEQVAAVMKMSDDVSLCSIPFIACPVDDQQNWALKNRNVQLSNKDSSAWVENQNTTEERKEGEEQQTQTSMPEEKRR